MGLVSLTVWYSYAIIRVVPRVERGEFLNVGVILFARTGSFLEARVELDSARLRALAAEADLELIERHLHSYLAVCAGRPEAGPLGTMPPSERFHWLTAPRSTVIQTSVVHVGQCLDASAALESILDTQVRSPRPPDVAPAASE